MSANEIAPGDVPGKLSTFLFIFIIILAGRFPQRLVFPIFKRRADVVPVCKVIEFLT